MANNFEYPGGFKSLTTDPTDPRGRRLTLADVQADPTYYIGYSPLYIIENGKHYKIVGGSVNNWTLEEIYGSKAVIPIEDTDAFDPYKPEIPGLPGYAYRAGDIVSYVNALSPTPQFQTNAIYIAIADVPIVGGVGGTALSPEESGIWDWQGQEYVAPSGTAANGAVANLTGLRNLSNMKDRDTVDVTNSLKRYRFATGDEDGIKPFSGEAGSWREFARCQPQLHLVAVLTKENNQANIGMVQYSKVLIHEITPSGSFSFFVDDEYGNEKIEITVTQPSIVTKYGVGYALSDFVILSIKGTTTVVTVDDADIFDDQKSGGYPAGAIVSYVNPLSLNPQFQTIALYVASITIPSFEGFVESPEANQIGWVWQGTEVSVSSGSTSNGSVVTLAQLRNISNIKNEDTVDVLGMSKTFKFYSTYEGGIKPYNGEAGSWIATSFIQPVLKLASVLTKENDGDNIVMSQFSKVVVYEVDPDSNSLSFNVEDESFNEVISITVTEPSIITKTGAGYTLSDFVIVPLGGSTTIINVEDADAYDENLAYSTGAIVSYVNPISPTPQFQTLALYVAESSILINETPEITELWLWQGTKIDVPSSSGATVFVPSIAALRQITGYKAGDTVSVVQGFTYKYMNVGTFQNGVDQYPFNQTTQDGNCWSYRWSSTELSLFPKISYSNLKYIIDAGDYDGLSITLDYQEGLILLNSLLDVNINGQNFTNQPNCIIYRNYTGALIQEALGGTALISKTYSELAALKTANGLVQGQQYLLTDHRTKHVIPSSSPVEINTGALEPIILTAIGTNSFHAEVKSTTFPTDIIHYRFDDDSCEDGNRDSANKKWTGGTARPGYIIYRKSTTNLLSTHYDWRNYKVRRWKLDAVAWVSEGVYTKNSVAKSVNDGGIYKAIKDHELIVDDPSTDTINWVKAFDLNLQSSNNAFLSYTPDKTNFQIGNIDNTDLIINNVTQGVDYEDYYTFCILSEPNNSSGVVLESIGGSIIGEGFKDFEIDKFDFEFSYWWGNAIDMLGDNVFYLLPDGNLERTCYSIKIGGSSSCNTFDARNLYGNTIGNLFQLNTIGSNFNRNNIGISFSNNNIGDGFSYNNIGISFYNNTTGNGFDNNNIGNGFDNNNIGNGFYNNNIGNGFYNNTIGDYFYSNTIGDDFNSNNTGNDFTNNNIGNYFYTVNYVTATPTPIHVYGNYQCTIFKRQDGAFRLSYYDNNDQLVITDVTA